MSSSSNFNEIRAWRHISIGFENLRQEQIIGIRSLNNDSFNMHSVPFYSYNKYDVDAGINVMVNFRRFFCEGKVTADWDFTQAFINSKLSFESYLNGVLVANQEQHYALATTKFQWYYINDALWIDIVGTLSLRNSLLISGYSDTALFQLGSWFRIYYWRS